MKIDFDSLKHEYKIDGIIVPSVTQVINADNTFYNIEAMKRGRKIHLLTHMYDVGDLELETLKDTIYYGYLKAWIKFKADTKIDIIRREYIVGSKKIMAAGTLDVLGLFSNDCWLLDIKSGVPEWWHDLQVSGYKFMHIGRETINKLGCVHLRANGTYRLKECEYKPFEFLEKRKEYDNE